MFFKNDNVKLLVQEVAYLKEQVNRLKIEQDAHWKVINSLCDRLHQSPYGIGKRGEPNKKPGRKTKEQA